MPDSLPTTESDLHLSSQTPDIIDHPPPSPPRHPTSPPDQELAPNANDEPPSKRQKVAGPDHRPLPRTISPPWKRVVADGPTTFLENGRRKSGRTNAIPLALLPQSNKRQTRAQFDKTKTEHEKIPKPIYNVSARPFKVEPSAPAVAKRADRTTSVSAQQHQIRSKESPTTSRSTRQSAIKPSSSVSTRRSLNTPSNKGVKSPPLVNGSNHHHPFTNAVVKSEHEENGITSDSDLSSLRSSRPSSPPLTLQRVTFRVSLPSATVATPANIAVPRKYSSFKEFLDLDELEPRAGEDTLTPEQITKEAITRNRVLDALHPGGLLDTNLSDSLPEKQLEPQRQYAHHDHLLAHVTHFRTLLRQERRDHKRKAEIIAYEAKRYVEEKSRRNKVKTAEEIEQEKRDATIGLYRIVVRDLDKLWGAVKIEVDAMRLKEYEEQQQAKMKGHLARVLDRTDQMLSRANELDDSIMNSDRETDASSNDTTDNDTENSEQMSESASDSEVDEDGNDLDAEMSIEELKRKYENLPSVPTEDDEVETPATDGETGLNLAPSDDDSDPEMEMDSEFDSDSSEAESDEDDGSGDGSRGGLLSLLFSKKEIANMEPVAHDNDNDGGEEGRGRGREEEQQVEGPDKEDDNPKSPLVQVLEETETPNTDTRIDSDDPTIVPDDRTIDGHLSEQKAAEMMADEPVDTFLQVARDPASQEPSAHTSPHTTATKVSEPESVSSIDARAESAVPVTPSEVKSVVRTPVPSLLRGTLREYQHEGLDWLADLYAKGRSGILADEMGLGKTIQSISVLAHLAEVHEVWGPHLIVVPTSVMLNWEMEFKKFLPGFKILTYYGNQEERKQKRRGWMADDSFNVCITSYQLVLQDANSFKRRRWHYMILDEAHNIKNFRSERWQTMMTFNTRARLLLTGTPLQNNLTELWSLLFFLHYGQDNEGEDDAFAGLKEWSEWFRRPVESILEHGRQVLDEEDKEQVAKLHKVIRPFLLRRLKRDVEKQMPLKYEHVEICRLSKRQRQLYDGFMSRAQTKETLSSGNYLSIINALMQLRKVCNHPDLFETRPINTSFAMPRSVAAEFEIRDLLVRRKLSLDARDNLDLDFLKLAPISDESMSKIEFMGTTKRHAYDQFKNLRDIQFRRVPRGWAWHGENRDGVLGSLENVGRKARLHEIERTMYYEAYRHNQHPVYGRGLLDKLVLKTTRSRLTHLANERSASGWITDSPMEPMDLVHSITSRSAQMEPFIQKFACITPAAVATGLNLTTVTEAGALALRQQSQSAVSSDPFHQARMKLSIAFPDKRLLQYDCGKLQRLDKLLRRLQAGGHRALIFTQMTKVLDILEQFLNIHGHRYLRLDGATKIEQRQILTDRFNNDTRILAFILSSRSGGLGINLTGADTVIFYDLDWNPAMDKQCTDRAHRIGQTRDVHIYRFVSEHTIESNILRKANQKQLLDDVVIQEGEFTTGYMNKVSYRDMLDDEGEDDAAGAAMDRVLGNDKTSAVVLEQAEDQEDRAAAKVAVREVQHADDGDFEDKATATATATPRTNDAQTPGPFGATETALAEAHAGEKASNSHHIDEYLVRLQTFLMRDIPLGPGKDQRKKGRRRDEHRVRRNR
ncbi:uncharacterized protein A1O9_06108 [Exophiala aquamarina CBS 119918]|uniref:DNA helicase n=1 Tax=Exophiala aquamarina CBS 119918 TaxID=1182545 RepID=A0A072PEJ0_9EURO|nr:uncharacterized protein A1O9_06108 [Exophiala aquamarina CBS 119918]KEF58182.1 hypothetical protein A1O9_06108 [Exophiala aquamarina CBS 119918]